MADQNVSISISADASSVAPAVGMADQLTTSLDAIVKGQAAMVSASTEASAALGRLAEGHGIAGESASKHAEAETFLGAALGKTETATNSAARAAGALGLATGEASERVFALTEALDALGTTAGPLIAVGAALLALGAGFNFIKDGVNEAEKMQVIMASLGQSVRNQGGDWDKGKESVEAFADSIRRATTYSGGEAVEALNSLTSAGVSLADAEKIVAISTDVAAGSRRSLMDVTNSVKEAELGHGRALASTDLVLKALIKSHGDLSQALSDLSQKYRGDAAAALDTAAGKSAALKNELDHLAEEIGVKLLPLIEETTEVLIGLAEGAEQHEPQIIKFFDDLINKAQEAYHVFWDLQNIAPWNVTNGADWRKAGTAWGDLGNRAVIGAHAGSTSPTGDWKENRYTAAQLQAMRQSGEEVPQGAVPGGVYWTPQAAPAYNSPNEDQNWLQGVIKSASDRAAKMRQDAAKDLQATRDQPLQHDVSLGGDKTAGQGPDSISLIDDDSDQKVSAYVEVQKQLDAALKDIVDSEKSYSEAVKLATDETSKDNAEMALHAKVSDDAQKAVGLLTGQVAYEQNEFARLSAEHDQASTKMNAAREAYNSYAQSLGEGTKRTNEQKDSLATLKAEHDEAKKTVDATKSALDGLSSSLETNKQKLAEAQDRTHDLAEAMAALDLAFNNTIAKNKATDADESATYGKSLQAQAAYWNSKAQIDAAAYVNGDSSYKQFLDREATDQDNHNKAMLKIADDAKELQKKRDDLEQSLIDEESVYGRSEAQTIAYYQARYAALVDGDSLEQAEAEKYAEDIEKIELDSYKKRIDAHKQMVDQIRSSEETLVNDILNTQGSLGDKLKSVWKTIGDDLEKNLVNGFLNSAPIAGFNNEIASMLGIPSAASANAPPQIVDPLNKIRDNTERIASAMLNGGGPGGVGGWGNSDADVSSFGAFGALFGSSGAASLISELPTSSGITGILAGDSAVSNLPSIALGGSDATAFAKSLGYNVGGKSFLSSAAGDVTQGAGIGGAVAGLDGGNSGYASIGGALGGLAAAVTAANPLAGAALEVGGALLGSLLGPHWGPATNYPDRSDPQYGQWLTNYQGQSATVNGQNVNPQNQYWEAIGGQSIEASIGQWVAQNANNNSLSAPMESLLKQFEALGGTNPGRDLGIQSEKNGVFTLWSGQQVSVTQLEQMVAQYQGLVGGTSSTAVFGLNRTYPDFTSTLTGQQGTVTTNQTGSGSTYTPNGGANAQPLQINIAIAGKNVGSVLINDIANGLQDVKYGIVPGSRTLSLAQRPGGN